MAYIQGVNGVPTANGRAMHLGLKKGELAPRIVTVGSLSRAKRMRALLDDPAGAFELASDRGYTTFTGEFEGTRVSIVAIGMGTPMMDFFVREARTITDGPMVVTRYGSCGGLRLGAKVGSVVVNTAGSLYVQRRVDAFLAPPAGADADAMADAYALSGVVAPDAAVAAAMRDALAGALGERLVEGLNASADGFYGSQGRIDANFDDRNGGLVERLRAAHPDVASLEMESYQLLHLARCSRGTIRAATAAIVVAGRDSGDSITTDDLHAVETEGGRAMLRAIAAVEL